MNIDHILQTFNQHGVQYLLLGGVNFLLKHQPILTYDVDLWIEPSAANRRCCESALASLDAQWGPTDETWQPVANLPKGWLADTQAVYCLASSAGAIDIFIRVQGMGDWHTAAGRADKIYSSGGSYCDGLSDRDMLECQLALEPQQRRQSRIEFLEQLLGGDDE